MKSLRDAVEDGVDCIYQGVQYGAGVRYLWTIKKAADLFVHIESE